MAIEKTLKKLVDAPGISGSEGNIRDIIKDELKNNVDEIRTDSIGNLITKKGNGKFKVMVTAHMDEPGFIVKHITKKGYIKFAPIGGWDPKAIPAQKVRIYTDKGEVIGVVGSKSIHLQSKKEMEKVSKLKKLFIDIGAKDKKDAEKHGVQPGDRVELYRELSKLKNSRITSNGLDNRAGCAALIELMKKIDPKNITVYGVGTVQEEIGLVGIRGSAFGVNPDVVLVMDTTTAGDYPGVSEKEESPIKLGKGPVILLKDALSLINSKIKKLFMDIAKKNKIPYQFEVISGGATEAATVSMVREGKPGGALSVPGRYIHTGVEVIDTKDLKKTVKLMKKSIENIKTYF